MRDDMRPPTSATLLFKGDPQPALSQCSQRVALHAPDTSLIIENSLCAWLMRLHSSSATYRNPCALSVGQHGCWPNVTWYDVNGNVCSCWQYCTQSELASSLGNPLQTENYGTFQ